MKILIAFIKYEMIAAGYEHINRHYHNRKFILIYSCISLKTLIVFP